MTRPATLARRVDDLEDMVAERDHELAALRSELRDSDGVIDDLEQRLRKANDDIDDLLRKLRRVGG